MTDRIQIFKGEHETLAASLDEIRAVWRMVSENPAITTRQIARRMGTGTTRTHHILKFLENAGYIRHQSKRTGRMVVIPFVHTKKEPICQRNPTGSSDPTAGTNGRSAT